MHEDENVNEDSNENTPDGAHKDTPTLPASDSAIESRISQSNEISESVGVRVCRACLTPPETKGSGFCGHCGEKLVTIRKAKDPYLHTIVGEKFTVVEKIGQGGMGEVYLATNDKIGQKVAIKFLSKRFADDENIVLRFLNEARSYCRVTHPNAVTLLEFGQHDTGSLFIITEFVEGLSITQTLKKVGPLSTEETLDIGIQIAEVLSAAHLQGVIHRDLKPDNIMLTPLKRGRFVVKVLDFGIAKIIDDDEGPATETGSVFGTPEFMSPEQARGDSVDYRSDLYAFGIILFFLLTGKLPFKGDNKLAVLNQQLHSSPPRLLDVRPSMTFSPGLESIIMKCLEKEPKYRFQEADELLEALESFRIDDGAFLTSHSSISESSESRQDEKKDEVRLKTVRLGEDQVSEDLSTPFDDQVVTADLQSIEMWREAPDEEIREGRSWMIWIGLILTVIAIFVGFSVLNSQAQDETNLEIVFNDGQTLGMISVAEHLLAEGQPEDAQVALERLKGWEISNKDLRKRMEKISKHIIKGQTLYSEFAKSPCEKSALFLELSKISKGLLKRAKKATKNCGKKVKKPMLDSSLAKERSSTKKESGVKASDKILPVPPKKPKEENSKNPSSNKTERKTQDKSKAQSNTEKETKVLDEGLPPKLL